MLEILMWPLTTGMVAALFASAIWLAVWPYLCSGGGLPKG
jgi:hypothetical protein